MTEIEAAGGVPFRSVEGCVQVLVVHRPKYDDWSFPKGKLDPGESFEDAAVREVAEETGLDCRLLDDLGQVRYRDQHGVPKVVRYWAMAVDADHGHEADDEVDELAWIGAAEAAELLTYDRDRRLLRVFLDRN